jgi:hypothetical protein
MQGEVTPALMQQSEIVGTAVSLDEADNPALTVYVDQDAANAGEVIRNLSRQIRSAHMQIRLMDEIHAMGNTAKQTPLLAQDVSTNPRAIGLLFAANNMAAFANPINQVLSFLGASMVGR